MCGIFFCASHKKIDLADFASLLAKLDKRGPDSRTLTHATIRHPIEEINLTFYSTVLSLRGSDVTIQPLVDQKTTSQLCWNGEAWSINGCAISGNDAEVVFQLLLETANERDDKTISLDDSVISVLNTIVGPFAFIFYDAIRAKVYFGRDALGRRSLLVKSSDKGLYLSSVGDGSPGWIEVPADGIFVMHLCPNDIMNASKHGSQSSLIDFPFGRCFHFPYNQYGKYHSFNHSIPPHQVSVLSLRSEPVLQLEKLLRHSLLIRTENIPFRIVSNVVAKAFEDDFNNCVADKDQHDNMCLEHHQVHSGRARSPRVAVLFSGGLDCTVLARLLHDILPSDEEIDLLNVAFHNPRVHGTLSTESTNIFETCPDRITARTSLAELNNVCSGRLWRLVDINIPYAEMLEHRDQVVSLMHPHETEMDLSIALALYFAARGVGAIRNHAGNSQPYQTPARVLFSGLGADELFGGYQRHATAYSRQGFKGLLDELELDINRLGHRNLGRDDRVISHWSKEARYPFLDEDLVKWAVTAPVWEKCGFGEAAVNTEYNEVKYPELYIEPGKKILRLLASKLDLKNVAQEKKRAIQFGARTAKMLVGKSKGTQRIV